MVKKTIHSLNDFSDDILSRIFLAVLGPIKSQEHYINNGIAVKHTYMEPTMVTNFDDLQHLPIVCKRWKRLVDESKELWKRIHISAALLRIPRDMKAWMRVFCWISKHAHQFESLHLADEASFRDNTLDGMKLGALSSFGYNLRILHLDHCFHRGANDDLLSIIPLMYRLEQLQISSVNHQFINSINVLSTMTQLKRLQIQGNGEYWEGDAPILGLEEDILPNALEVLSLSNIRVRGSYYPQNPLRHLKILELIYIEWMGTFIECVAQLEGLENLIVVECDKITTSDTFSMIDESDWTMLSCTKLKEFTLRNSKYGEFCSEMSNDFTGFTLLHNLKKLVLCPEVTPADNKAYYISGNFSKLENLQELNLENCGFQSVPPAILEIKYLKHLNLSGNKLTTLFNVKPVFYLTLETLSLDNNKFKEIPDLSGFDGLKEIHIANNPLELFKDLDYLANLKNLQVIRLGSRRVLDFPESPLLQVKDLCTDLNLKSVGAFYLGKLTNSLMQKKKNFTILF